MPRPSTIDRLPEDLREALHEWLRDPSVTQMDATDRLNAVIDQVNAERPEDDQVPHVSKSSVNRYHQRMEEVGERLRQSRQVAEMWIAKLGAQPQGQLGHLINETLRTLAFDLTLKLQEGELTEETMPAVIDQLKELSLSVMRLERASSENVKREAEIRKQAQAEAADAAEQAARTAGVSADGITAMRQAILEGMGA